MGNIRLDLSTETHVVNVSSGEIRQMVVSIRNIQEVLFSRFVSWIGSWMILEGQLLVSSFDLIKGGVSSHTKDLIVALLLLRIMLLEEVLFVLIHHSFVFIEPIKDLVGIINGVVGRCQDIILVSSSRIRQIDVGFSDVIESFLSS